MSQATQRYQQRSAPYRWPRGGAQDIEEQEEVVVVIPPEVLQAFIRRVYLIASIFVVLSVITWTIASATKFSLTDTWPVPAYVWILSAFVCMSILCCCPVTRITFPVNWILTSLIIVFLTIYGVYLVESVSFAVLLTALAITLALIILLHVCGALCAQILLPNLICTGCIMLLGFIILFVLGVVYLVTKKEDILLGFCVLLFILVILMIPFHAQLIHGRFQYVPVHDALGCAENFYIHFVLLLYCLCYFYEFDSYYIDNRNPD